MKLGSFFQSFGFTRNEIKVVLLLAATFLFGVAIRQFKSTPEKGTTKGFDYSVPDSIFRQRSSQATEASGTEADDSSVTVSGKPTKADPNDVVNINTAVEDELLQLPGIGPAYAGRIISYRKEHGPFTSIDELENVKGIGKKRLERLRPLVRVK